MPHAHARIPAAVAAVLTLVLMRPWWPASAAAAEQKGDGPVMGLLEVYPRGELIAGGVGSLGLLTLSALRTTIGPGVRPSLGDPDPRSLDARITRRLYAPGRSPFLARVPDIGGYIYPVVAALGYTTELTLKKLGYLGGADPYGGYPAIALTEALVWNQFSFLVLNYSVGRRRPAESAQFGGPDPRISAANKNLAFYSGHSAAAFTASSFLALSVGGRLARHWHDRPLLRIGVARLLVPLGFYGLATLVAASRVIDGQHYFSDVALGALTGLGFGHLFYLLHFDLQAQPRRAARWRGLQVGLLPVPGGSGLAFSFTHD